MTTTKIWKDVFLLHTPHLGVPGAYTGPYTGKPITHPVNYTFITRYVQWHVCAGRSTRGVCIINTGDCHHFPRFAIIINHNRHQLFLRQYHILRSTSWKHIHPLFSNRALAKIIFLGVPALEPLILVVYHYGLSNILSNCNLMLAMTLLVHSSSPLPIILISIVVTHTCTVKALIHLVVHWVANSPATHATWCMMRVLAVVTSWYIIASNSETHCNWLIFDVWRSLLYTFMLNHHKLLWSIIVFARHCWPLGLFICRWFTEAESGSTAVCE